MDSELEHGARVLLIRLSALGDVLFALETLASLKAERPDVRVDFLVGDRFAPLLRNHPQIERSIAFPRHSRLALPGHLRRLRRTRYSAALDLHGILKSAVQLRLARAERRIGFAPPGAREGAYRLYGERVALPEPLPHRADRGYALLRALGLSGAAARPVLPPPDEPVDFWNDAPRPRVVLHPGASAFAAFKRWPPAKFRELGARLAARGLEVAVSFGPGEGALAEDVRAGDGRLRALDGPALGLLGLAQAFADTDVVVAADTGPLHIGAAVGARVVALFGPKDPALYGPRGDGHRVLFSDVPCRPCRRRSCASPQCVLGIGVDEAERAVLGCIE